VVGDSLRFPLIPLLIPVVMAVMMAVVFSSALALMMGALGPLIVLSGWWDQVRQARKNAVATEQAYHDAKEIWENQQATEDMAHHAELHRKFPKPTDWIDDRLWRGYPPNTTEVRVGSLWWGSAASEVFQTSPRTFARPALVDVTQGLCVVGGGETIGAWRSLVAQWCATGGRPSVTVTVSKNTHQVPRDIRGMSRLVWVASLDEVPSECSAVLVVSDGLRATLSISGQASVAVRLDTLGLAGLGRACAKLTHSSPDQAPRGAADFSSRNQLWFGLQSGGEMWDLVKCGPHAVVWGSTGSGKSVTVVTMVSSLLAHYSPADLVVVVIDFKGGAGLKPLENAPHTIGVVTDLEPGKSARALLGMRTEMVKRETLLARHGVSDLAFLPRSVDAPRLLVVVDEVAWLLTNNPDWSDLLQDVLARGRSLGIHVVLSTQRVSGVLTRAMMANVALRMCGRVSDDQELVEWMPGLAKDVAKLATRAQPGEVVLSAGDDAPNLVDVDQVVPPLFSFQKSEWRVWVEDLPAHHLWNSESFGVMECVHTQQHANISYRPEEGSVLVVGDRKSGRTSAGHAIASLHPEPWGTTGSAAEAWLALVALSGHDQVLVIDDADVLLQSVGGEGEAFLLEAIEGFSGTLVMSCQPGHRMSRQLSRLVPHTLCLSIAKSEQAVLWEALASLLPGRGTWRGSRVQVGYEAPAPRVWLGPKASLDTANLIVVSDEPEAWVGHGVHATVTVDHFSRAWMAGELGLSHPDILWDRISHREVRYATGGKAWIPPLDPPAGAWWVWSGGNPILARPADW
jgi:DNA segregation ATPase FtsK/SpoIIIE, S-DNA-T family